MSVVRRMGYKLIRSAPWRRVTRGASSVVPTVSNDPVRRRPGVSRNQWWGREAGSDQATRIVEGAGNVLEAKKVENLDGIATLSEVRQFDMFLEQLNQGLCTAPSSTAHVSLDDINMRPEVFRQCLTSGFATMCLHVESRIAAFLGEGFYTIGPGGEELLSAVGCALTPDDATALHYRHLSTQIARQLASGTPLQEILLNRARGHVVSVHDPVTGGVHCALGGGRHDYLVTSTLASHATPAVGRALGASLAQSLHIPCDYKKGFVSYVSAGDGSVNNAHWLSAVNMAQYAHHRLFRCPVVFAVTDNDLCISLRGYNWMQKYVQNLHMPVFQVDGTDMMDIWRGTNEALAECRKRSRPVMILFNNVPRRFGHAATDRQTAYLTEEEISSFEATNPLAGACAQAVREGVATYDQLADELTSLRKMTAEAFSQAAAEPKIERRSQMMDRNCAPCVVPTSSHLAVQQIPGETIMRKNMTAVLDELLTVNPQCVYLGEDVVHGGYYLVTQGLERKFGPRVRDFPPDETSLLGVATGFSQVGLTPIVEIPYAKYLDCGADMFFELALNNWLSNGTKPNGMIIRLQGFGAGVFGGNFHTHNSLHIPPGIDVVCYSNGADYVRGMRYAFAQARAGRVVMSVDATDLLNRRHLHDKDDAWKRRYPAPDEFLSFDQVNVYGSGRDACIVAYGNTVPESLIAAKQLQDEHGLSVSVIDTPYLSSVPQGLRDELKKHKAVVFADPCKQGQNPLANYITTLQALGELPAAWQSVAAVPTYNPLGTTLTFTNSDDITWAVHSALGKADR